MKLLAIRYYTVSKDNYQRLSDCEDIWYANEIYTFEQLMNEDILPWANHHGFAVEVTGKIYEEDAE